MTKTPQELKAEAKKLQARHALWRRGNLSWLLKDHQKRIFEHIDNEEEKVSVVLSARQVGKCIKFDQLVATPEGPRRMEDLKEGDYVLGYNSDGSVSPTRIVAHLNTGKKKLHEIWSQGKMLVSASEDHVLLTKFGEHYSEKKIKELTAADSLVIINPETKAEEVVSDYTFRNGGIALCYDIQIDNETNLFCLANGLVTHNSFLLFVHATEYCLKHPNSNVLFVAPTRQMCKEIIRDKKEKLFDTCPDELKPDWLERDFSLVFPNGSRIALLGTEQGSADRIRGRSLNQVYIDEAGFTKDLNNLVRSVAMPTLSTTGGRLIMASTPPKSKNHDMIGYIREAQSKGKLYVATIYDNPLVSEEDIEALAKASGGYDSPDFRREYLAEIIIDEESLVVPEFTPELEREVVQEPQRPAYFDAYVSMDIGFNDHTAALFAYYDAGKGHIVIEDEVVLKGKTTDVIAQSIKYKESELWTNEFSEQLEPRLRVSDTNLLLIADLDRIHDIRFEPTKKDNKDAAINEMRMMLRDGRIIINPKCHHLLNELRLAEWTTNGKDFKRLNNGSHCDALMALVYLVRNVDLTAIPMNTPKTSYGYSTEKHYSRSALDRKLDNNPFASALAKTFNIKRR
jgi:hypothetical protein